MTIYRWAATVRQSTCRLPAVHLNNFFFFLIYFVLNFPTNFLFLFCATAISVSHASIDAAESIYFNPRVEIFGHWRFPRFDFITARKLTHVVYCARLKGVARKQISPKSLFFFFKYYYDTTIYWPVDDGNLKMGGYPALIWLPVWFSQINSVAVVPREYKKGNNFVCCCYFSPERVWCCWPYLKKKVDFMASFCSVPCVCVCWKKEQLFALLTVHSERSTTSDSLPNTDQMLYGHFLSMATHNFFFFCFFKYVNFYFQPSLSLFSLFSSLLAWTYVYLLSIDVVHMRCIHSVGSGVAQGGGLYTRKIKSE